MTDKLLGYQEREVVLKTERSKWYRAVWWTGRAGCGGRK